MKKAYSDLQKKIIDMACFLLTVFLMVLLSIVAGEKEIIFPEVGAIAAGMFLTPHRSWMTNGRRMFLLLLVCGIIGMGIVRFVPLPLTLQMILGYAVALFIQSVSGTSFMPMISALVLPILLQTRSLLYIASIVIFTSIIIVLRKILEKSGVKAEEEFIPVQKNLPVTLSVFRLVVASVMIFAAIKTGWRFMVAPPLLVAFTELSAYKNKVIRMHPIRVIILLTLSAASGAYVRMAFVRLPGIFTIVSLLISSVIFLIIFYHTGPMVPPAGAAMVLAYLAPEKMLATYPIQICAGISVYVGVTLIRNAVMKKYKSDFLFFKNH